MKTLMKLALCSAALVAATSYSLAQDEGLLKAAKARQSVMQLYSFNLGKLGAMVKGEMDYDADQAKIAADNLVAAASIRQDAMWPEGTAMEDAGMEGKTWAKKAAWDTYPEVANKHKALQEAAAKMAEAAGGGVDAIKAAIGGVGGSCKGCHDDFRAPKQ